MFDKKHRVLGIIPSRYASTRFPGKPLAMIGDKTMIRRVYEQCLKAECLDKVVVATDDERIYSHVVSFGGNVVMTRSDHPSGTDRCHEAYRIVNTDGEKYDIIVNIQGDEPFIDPHSIEKVIGLFDNPETRIATLAKKIVSAEEISDPNVVKVVFDAQNRALYFSRNPIPFIRQVPASDWITRSLHFKHIGLYAFKDTVLSEIIMLPVHPLEQAESLEQLRWLLHGYPIIVGITDTESLSVDTPGDLSKITNIA